MRFLVDAQLPPALARWLSSRGDQVELLTWFEAILPRVLQAFERGETLVETT